MLEGYLLYKALIVVFDTGESKRLPLYLCGYGAPLVIVMITLVVALIVERDQEETDYHNPQLCWLGKNYIYYALDAPVIAVLLCNTFVLFKGIGITWRVILFFSYFQI